jgi:hypothetical protein
MLDFPVINRKMTDVSDMALRQRDDHEQLAGLIVDAVYNTDLAEFDSGRRRDRPVQDGGSGLLIAADEWRVPRNSRRSSAQLSGSRPVHRINRVSYSLGSVRTAAGQRNPNRDARRVLFADW